MNASGKPAPTIPPAGARVRAGMRQAAAAGGFAALALMGSPAARAQDIEPRAYANTPVGVNFLVAGYVQTRGGLSSDTALPVSDPHLETSSAVIAYARSIDLWGRSGKVDVMLPYTWLSGTASCEGAPIEREVSGMADARFRVSANLY